MTEADFFEKLRKQLDQKLPFVAYRKPEGRQVKALLQKDESLHTTTDFIESGFVFAPFDDRKKPILIPENASEKLVFEQEVSEEISLSGNSQKEEVSKEKRSAHIQLVKKAVSALKAGEMDKVVLSRKEKVKLEKSDPVDLFEELLKNYPAAFVYLWFHPKVGLWLGATPETLLKVQGSRFSTMALAGTQKYEGTMEVSWGEKEKQEQLFVTDSILENLENLGVSLNGVDKSEVYTAKAGDLLHLRTDIKGEIPNFKFQIPDFGTQGPYEKTGLNGLLSALHPTPAVCGLPKEKAKEFILSEENYNREFYTGFLGEINLQTTRSRARTRRNVENLAYKSIKKETSLYVNLRCMKIEDDFVMLYIGGGITKDSIPEAEWEETVNKSQTMKKVLLKKQT